jgi:hypothetical protein
MKKRYQIDKHCAVQQFRKLAAQSEQSVRLVIPLKEGLELVQRGRRKKPILSAAPD